MRLRLAFLLLLLIAVGSIVYFLVNLHYIDIDIDKIIEKRLSVYTQTIDCGRNSKEINEYFPDSAFVINTNKTTTSCPYQNTIDTYSYNNDLDGEQNYKLKYVDTLSHCMSGDRMLCMVLEDDVTFLQRNASARRNIVINTISLFTNDDCFYDCSKRGLWLKTGSTGNKSLCRIFSKERLPYFIPCLTEEDDPIDLAIDRCQLKHDICQKRFLLVQHTGMTSTLGHWTQLNPY